MEKILQTIERLREYPEPVRRQLLWVFVTVAALLLAGVWALTLGWQIRDSEAAVASAETSIDSKNFNLPSIRQSLRNDVDRIQSGGKNTLRQFLLGKDSEPSGDSEQAAQPSGSPPSTEDLPQLPR